MSVIENIFQTSIKKFTLIFLIKNILNLNYFQDNYFPNICQRSISTKSYSSELVTIPTCFEYLKLASNLSSLQLYSKLDPPMVISGRQCSDQSKNHWIMLEMNHKTLE